MADDFAALCVNEPELARLRGALREFRQARSGMLAHSLEQTERVCNDIYGVLRHEYPFEVSLNDWLGP